MPQRIRTTSLNALVVLLLAVAPTTTRGQSWVGRRVVPSGETFSLLAGDPAKPIRSRMDIYRVERTSGDWLWLTAPGMAGWASASQVVPVERGIDHFTGRIRKNPKEPFAYIMRARLWQDRGDPDRAIGDYSEALRLKPSVELHNTRGSLWAAKGDFAKAIADFDEAIRLDPKYAMAYSNRGVAWYLKGEPARAQPDLDEAIRLDPKSSEARHNRGVFWIEKRAFDKALADLDEVVRLDPLGAKGYLSRARVWHAREDYGRALSELDEAIRRGVKDAAIYNNRAWMRATCPEAKHRDGLAAIEDAARACEMTGFRNPETIATLAAAHAEAGDFDQAIKLEERVLQMIRTERNQKTARQRLALFRAKQPYHESAKSP